MKRTFSSSARLLPGIIATFLLIAARAQAGHVYAGIVDTNGQPGLQDGDALAFINSTTDAHDPHYGKAITGGDYGEIVVSGLVTDTTIPQHGLYSTKEPTFTALSRGVAIGKEGYHSDSKEFAAAAHSFVELKLVSVDGPKGAHFSYWETGSTSATFTYTIGSGVTAGSGRFHLTDPTTIIGDGSTPLPAAPDGGYVYPDYSYPSNPAKQPVTAKGLPQGFCWNNATGAANSTAVQDPFGHIHGRRFTFDQLGSYHVTYVLIDANGHQASSAPFTLTYSVLTEAPAKPASEPSEGGKSTSDNTKSKDAPYP